MKFVKADKPVTTKHAKLGEISVDVEVPELESIDEFVQFAGGNDGALEFINNAVATAAKNGGRAALHNADENANVDALKADIASIVKDYTPRSGGERSPIKTKKLAAFDNIKALVESGAELTREQLLEMLALSK